MIDYSKALKVSTEPKAARGINSADAKEMFRKYHGLDLQAPETHPHDSQGKLQVCKFENDSECSDTNTIPMHYFEVTASVIKGLSDSIPDGTEFVGLAGIPGNRDGADTFIWVAIIKQDDKIRFNLPSDSDNEDLIYDHIDTCPHHCKRVANSDRLWVDWQEGPERDL